MRPLSCLEYERKFDAIRYRFPVNCLSAGKSQSKRNDSIVQRESYNLRISAVRRGVIGKVSGSNFCGNSPRYRVGHRGRSSLGEALEEVGEVSTRLQAVGLGRFDERVERRAGVGAVGASTEHPAFSSDDKGADGVLVEGDRPAGHGPTADVEAISKPSSNQRSPRTQISIAPTPALLCDPRSDPRRGSLFALSCNVFRRISLRLGINC
jgi:hypothetical protein